jgi:hypothetical protein
MTSRWVLAFVLSAALWLWAAGTLMAQLWPRFTAAVQVLVITSAFVLMVLWLVYGAGNRQ